MLISIWCSYILKRKKTFERVTSIDKLHFSGIIQKYSNFVGSPIFVNGKRINVIQVCLIMYFCLKKITVFYYEELIISAIVDARS